MAIPHIRTKKDCLCTYIYLIMLPSLILSSIHLFFLQFLPVELLIIRIESHVPLISAPQKLHLVQQGSLFFDLSLVHHKVQLGD